MKAFTPKWKNIAVLLVVLFAFFLVYQLARGPEHDAEKQLQSDLVQTELRIFNVLDQRGLGNANRLLAMKSETKHIDELRVRAAAIYGTIPALTVIERDHKPVGENIEVTRLNDEADHIEQQLIQTKRDYAITYATNLLSTSQADLLENYHNIGSTLAALHNKYGWYYNSPVHNIGSYIRTIVIILFFPAIVIIFASLD